MPQPCSHTRKRSGPSRQAKQSRESADDHGQRRRRATRVPARTRLLNEVQRAGREAAAYGIMLTVQKKNRAACRFYTKHGIDDLKVAEDGADFEIRALLSVGRAWIGRSALRHTRLHCANGVCTGHSLSTWRNCDITLRT